MSKEIDEVFEKIKGFKETITEVLSQGLKEKALPEAESLGGLDDQDEDVGAMADKKDASPN